MNVHDEVEPRKVSKKFGSEKSPIHFCQVLKKDFCRSSKKGQRLPEEQEWTFAFFLFMCLKQFHNPVQPHKCTRTYMKENSLDRDRHQQKMVRKSIR